MINYSEQNVLDEKVKKCLMFDPFDNTIALDKDTINLDNQFNLVYLKNKINITNYNKLKAKYYNCASDCFELYQNLPIVNYHYEISCVCIKDCFDQILEEITKF